MEGLLKPMMTHKTTFGRKTWNIPEAALIGIGSCLTFGTLLYLSGFLLEQHGYDLALSRYQLQETKALVAQVGTALIFGPAILSIARRRHLAGLWESIEWNTSKLAVVLSIACGAILSVLVSTGLRAIYGATGSLRSPATVALVLLSEVLVAPLIEEVYFRGILFIALATRFSGVITFVIVTALSSFIHLGHMVIVLPLMTLLGLVRLKTGSVANCFAMHASYNLFVAVYSLVVTGGPR